MNLTNSVELTAPYLLFLGESPDPLDAKTGLGIAQWRRESCVAQFRLPGCRADAGLPDMTPAEAAAAGAKSFIVGVAPIGGQIPPSWIEILETAARCGMDIVSGLHVKLTELPTLVSVARQSHVRLVDIRIPPTYLPVGTGVKRTGRRLLTVGTDCAVGKKYTALAIEREMSRRGWHADFRATGQTGIMIAGVGIPIDAVVSDFVAGAAEVLSPDNDPMHWDVIEGQGAILHPGYAAVSLGLLHGSQPDAFVVCHEIGRDVVGGWPQFPLPSIARVINLTVRLGALTNPAIRCVGISVNSASMTSARRQAYRTRSQQMLGLPCVDPLIDGVAAIVDVIEAL